jgi:hypothetical protein
MAARLGPCAPFNMLFLLLYVVISGCSSTRSQQTAMLLDPYVGHSLSDVADRFGSPSGNFASSDNGRMEFQWDHFSENQTGGAGCRVLISALPTYGDSMVTPPTDRANWIVKSWSSYGSGCP